MMLVYQHTPIFVHSFRHKLGRVRRDLNELKADKLLAGSVDTLAAMGYRYCFGLGENETLLELAAVPLGSALKHATEPRALVFQHCHAESAVLPYESGDTIGASRNRYFAAAVMQKLEIDHLPYFCSFASGCAGFLSLVVAAGGLFPNSDERPTVCVMADSRPNGIPFDLLRERILGSDHSSAFVVGREDLGYQLLGVSYYSTMRKQVPLVEIVKRTVEMVQGLANRLTLDLAGSDVAIHYPNIFPDTWQMATRYLRIPGVEHVMDEMSERAHCGATDSVISLAKFHRGQRGRLHVVVNYGVGLHLGVCILEERDSNAADN
jgi:3-oxoacyl-[acyl-carrier-protein] synthase III